MEPQTLSSMSPSEQQIKNRLLSDSTNSKDYSSLDSMNTYNPQSIMNAYSSARKLTTNSAAANEKRLNSEYSTAVEDTNIADTKDVTSTLESQSGFAQMPVALNYMQISHDKRIRDLTKQRNELLLSNESDKSKTLSDLILKEETAMSNAKTNFLSNYFNINKEKREAAGFQTPDQKAIQSLQANAPDANILSTDTYQDAITKYKNSETYRRDVRRGELEIKQIEANIRQSDAAARKSLVESGSVSNMTSTGQPYNGDFAATIDLAAGLGSTNQERIQMKNDLKNFIAAKDYKSAYSKITQATVKGLKGDSAMTFQEQANNLGVLIDLKKAIQAYNDAGGKTNIFKGTADQIQTKIGKLMTDPAYGSLAVQLDMAFQNYRQKMTGAAFSGQESGEYSSVLPSKGNTMDLNISKLNGAENYLNSSINSSIRSIVGEGGVHIKDYAMMNPTTQETKTLQNPSIFQGFKLKYY